MRTIIFSLFLSTIFLVSTNNGYSDTAPMSEDFDGVSVPNLPASWSSIVNSTSGISKVETTTNDSPESDPNHVRLYNSHDNAATLMLITPQLTDLTGQSNQIRFYAKASPDDCELIIGTMSDPSNEATFTSFSTIGLTDTYAEYIIMFNSTYTETDEYIAFKHGLGGMYRTIYIDNFHYEEIPSCPRPNDLGEDNISSDAVDLSWAETASATTWNIRIGETGWDTTGASHSIETNDVVTVDTLSDDTEYDWYVRASCGAGDHSEWVGPNMFATYCNSFTETINEDFDGVPDPEMPHCWSNIVNSSSSDADIKTYTLGTPHSEPNHLRMYNADDASAELLLITPQYSDLTGQSNQIRFYAKALIAVDLIIGTMTDLADETTFASFDTVELTTSYVEHAIEFGTSYTGTGEYIAFKHCQGTAHRVIYIDDFNYEPIPSCKVPVDQEVTNKTTDGATFGWTEIGTASIWDIYIVGIGEDGPEDETTPTIDDTGDNPYTWSNGDAGTTYDWYVRSDCGGDNADVSTWKGYNTFATIITNDDCSGTISLNVGYGEDWTQGTNDGATESDGNPDPIPSPDCANYNGGDIWYSANVPASGYLVVTSQKVVRSNLTNSGMAIYTGICSSLLLYECDDNSSPDGNMSEIIIDDISLASSTVYIRYWDYSNNDVGPFEITAYTNPTNATWTGNTDDNWETAENWDVNGVPGIKTSVTIPSVATSPTIQSGTNAKCHSIEFQNGATITINGQLEVDN